MYNSIFLNFLNFYIITINNITYINEMEVDAVIKVTLTNEILKRISGIDENRFFSQYDRNATCYKKIDLEKTPRKKVPMLLIRLRGIR